MMMEHNRVQLIGDHPHAGQYGKIVEIKKPLSCLPVMAKIELESGDGCFAERKHIRVIEGPIAQSSPNSISKN